MPRKAKWKGYVAAALGCLVGFFALWKAISMAQDAAHGVFPTLGPAVGYLVRITVVLYCAFIARRHLSSQPMSTSPWQSAGWARIVIGAVLFGVCIKQLVWPSPTAYQPSNPAEAVGALFVKVIFIPGLGLGLIIWGIARAFQRSETMTNQKEPYLP
jgi:hypothetical protein